MVERNRKLETHVVPNIKRGSLLPLVYKNIKRGAHVYTDEFRAYSALPAMGYKHDTISFSDKAYVMGNTHTNTIEGFWSLVKNGNRGVYQSVSLKHLQNYLNEYFFRYNKRNQVTPMFSCS